MSNEHQHDWEIYALAPESANHDLADTKLRWCVDCGALMLRRKTITEDIKLPLMRKRSSPTVKDAG